MATETIIRNRRVLSESEEDILIRLGESKFEPVSPEEQRSYLFRELESVGLIEQRGIATTESTMYYLTPQGEAYARELAA